VDGTPNVRACETPCRDRLVVETQNAIGGAARDLLGAIDVLAPGGIDHHRLATWSHVANRLAVSASRRLAGLGLLPDAVEQRWPAADETFDAAVIGSGPAGVGAAEVLAARGLRVILLEREGRLGGRLRCALDLPGDPPLAWAAEVAAAVRAAGGDVATRAPAIGVWPQHGGGALLAVPARGDAGPVMRLLRVARVVLAGGTWAQPPVFEGNDLPGIHGARGLCVALAEDGVLAGKRAVVLGHGDEADAVAHRFTAAGMEVELVGAIARARGRGGVSSVELPDGRSVRCDVVAVATPRQPAYELAREAGAEVELDAASGTHRLRLNGDGAVAPGIYAAGELIAPCSARDAAIAGRRAGEAASRG
jgi:sarcosine oxidase subunit alpha